MSRVVDAALLRGPARTGTGAAGPAADPSRGRVRDRVRARVRDAFREDRSEPGEESDPLTLDHQHDSQLTWRLAAVPVAAAVLWILSLLHADPRSMGSLGLVDLFSIGTVGALVLLTAGLVIGLYRGAPEWVLGAHLVGFLALIHATPAILYGTLRYSWSYKHVGIVDYIMRTGTVDPTLAVGGIYHNWPGMFAGSALLTELAGQPNAIVIATWAPFAFSLMNLVLLRYVYRSLTRNRRLIWLGLWFFFVINWVGQEYFSPQALAYVLYLACLGMLLRRTMSKPVIVTFALTVGAVAVSHQITPMMLLLAVTALVIMRRTHGWYLPVIAAVLIAGWAFSGARDYTVPNLYELVEGLGRPVDNAAQTLDKATIDSGSQAVVVWGGRGVVIGATLLALLGAWRSWRVRGLRISAILLMALPAVLVLVTGFGGEVLFRSFLFAAPFIAFLCAAACLPRDGRGFFRRNVVAVVAATAVLLPGFLLGYYGKEAVNYFTPDEVAAAQWVDDHGAPGSLLVEGSRNYPAQAKHYENFTYVALDREPEESYPTMLADPARKFEGWLSDPRYREGFILLTRSQQNAIQASNAMPPGALDRIESSLKASSDFRIAYENSDAVVFTLASQAGGDR